jgi:hypothetical protein
MPAFERRYNTLEQYTIIDSPGVAVIKQGSIAKTTRLIGCFVPVIIDQSEVTVGHFGPKQSLKAQLLITRSNSSSPPKDIILYRCSLSDNPWWREQADLYEACFQNMTNALTDITGVEKNIIHARVCPTSSSIVINWTRESEPCIDIVPTTI